MKTIKDLALALLNATLILIALCLFFVWQISNTAERVAGNFAQNLEVLAPLRGEVEGMRADLAGLRGDLAELQSVPGQTADAIEERIDALIARMDLVQGRMAELADTPERLMTTAIDRSAEHVAGTLNDLAGCTRPDMALPES